MSRATGLLSERKIAVNTALPRRLQPGKMVFLAGGTEENHSDFVVDAWVAHPVTDLINRLREYWR